MSERVPGSFSMTAMEARAAGARLKLDGRSWPLRARFAEGEEAVFPGAGGFVF